MLGKINKILMGIVLVGGFMNGNCSQSFYASNVDLPQIIEQSSVLRDSTCLPKSNFSLNHDVEFSSLIPIINEINEAVISCEEDDIQTLSKMIVNEVHMLKCDINNEFTLKTRLFMTDNILNCNGKKALLWSYVAQHLGCYISDETIGQIHFLLRNGNY